MCDTDIGLAERRKIYETAERVEWAHKHPG